MQIANVTVPLKSEFPMLIQISQSDASFYIIFTSEPLSCHRFSTLDSDFDGHHLKVVFLSNMCFSGLF